MLYHCSADSFVSSKVCHMPQALLAGSVRVTYWLWMLMLQLLPPDASLPSFSGVHKVLDVSSVVSDLLQVHGGCT